MENDKVLTAAQKKLGKKYQYIKCLGGGGFSKVYLMRHTHFNEDQVLKIMDFNYLFQKLEKENFKNASELFDNIKLRFVNEAKLYKKIDHPNIVKIYDIDNVTISHEGKEIDIPYLMMQYVKGENLKEIIVSRAPLPLNVAVKITKDMLSAIDFMHRNNIIHRDIKPSNIMVETKSGSAILIDFGLAKDELNEADLTGSRVTMGTPAYMSPEQCSDSGQVDSSTDIYSFGAVLYEMLTGETPFYSKNTLNIIQGHIGKPIPDIIKKNPTLPPGIKKVINKSMAKKTGKRYNSAQEFLDAFTEVGDKEKIHRESIIRFPSDITQTEVKHGKKIWWYSSVVLVVVIILFYIFNLLGNSDGEDGQWGPGGTLTTGTLGIQTIRTVEMQKEFQLLETFLKSTADSNEKLEKCKGFLDSYSDINGNNVSKALVSRTTGFIASLEADIETDKLYRKYIDSVKSAIQKGDFKKALDDLKNAKEIKDTPEIKELADTIVMHQKELNLLETQSGKDEYDAVKQGVSLSEFLQFKEKYPDSVYLEDLEKRLRVLDPHLPPKKYWDLVRAGGLRALKRNQKGYYEATFTARNNGHIMIFLPKLSIWIDKYEVSWRQFRQFLVVSDRKMSAQKSTKYIRDSNHYPAVVTYKDALAYCHRYGFALPSAAQWEYAAGGGRFRYPWGNEAPDAGGRWRANGESLEDGYEGTAPVNSFDKYSSPFGLVNMAGNVKEWVSGKILKGGGFFSEKEDMEIKKIMKPWGNDKEGFRCIKPESRELGNQNDSLQTF